jgi:hypothetical protein
LQVSGSIRLADVAVHPTLGGINPSLLDYTPFMLTIQDDTSIQGQSDAEGRFALNAMSIRDQYVIFCKYNKHPGFVLEYMAADSSGLYGEHKIELSIRSTARSLIARCMRDRYGRRVNPQSLQVEHIDATVRAIAEVLEKHPEKLDGTTLDQVAEVKMAYTAMADALHQGQSGVIPNKWVFLFYMGGDNNLSNYISANLDDIKNAGLPDNSKILAQADFPVHGMKRLLLTDDDWLELGSMPDIDSSRAEVIADFLAFSRRSFPAENYVLIISSHADGWKNSPQLRCSLISDETSGSLGNPLEIAAYIKGANTQFAGFNRPLELIVFDACNMAMIEIAYEFNDCAAYSVFSQAFVPGNGFPFYNILKTVSDQGADNISAFTMGSIICDEYKNRYISGLVDTGATVSLVDNAAMANFMNRLQSYFAKIQQNLLNYAAVLVNLRDSTTVEIEDAANEYVIQAFESADYRDLKDFILQGRNAMPDTAIEADLVLESFANLVKINHVSTRAFPRAYGLSIGFPDKATYEASYVSFESLNYHYYGFNQNSVWGQILAVINQ